MKTFLSTTSEINSGRNGTRTIELRNNNASVSFDSSCPHPRSAPSRSTYDAFLSFRGADTRNNFVSFLYKELERAWVNVFQDERQIRCSEEIDPTLIEAIDKSTISIPVFSKDYASSRSCLMEVAKISECMRTKGQVVLPIFFNIEPSDVRNQKGTFEQSFRKHEESGVEPQHLEIWKEALKKVGSIKGYTVSGDQAELVGQVVSRVLELLETDEIPLPEYLVAMDERVQALAEKLQVSSSDVRIVGICGMAGIGKTTLAKFVYNKFCHQFQASSFVFDIRERSAAEGLCSLQRQLIISLLNRKIESQNTFENNMKMIMNKFRNMKVLIVLDDVECEYHCEAFVSLNHFGPGSRIILTARMPKFLGVAWYNLEALSDQHALELFNWHAFRKDSPEGKFCRLSIDIASNTGGIPMVIKLVGSYLSTHRNSEERWKEVLRKLKNCDEEKLKESLRISYSHLTEDEQQLYLDIACFLTGESNGIACYMWEDCGFYPLQGIERLCQLSLLKIGENDELLMSNPGREFGRKLVLNENTEPRRRSRLWIHREALKIVKEKKGTEYIKAICLQFNNEPGDCPTDEELGSGSSKCLKDEEFESLLELRFLRLDGAKISGDFQNLLPEIRWLDWKNLSEVSEELKNLYLKNLVILDMSGTNVTKTWKGWESITERAEKLKVLLLANCSRLEGSPCFPDRRQLERLNFEHCSQLRRINISSSTIKTLAYLNIKDCCNINELPQGLSSMIALKELIIDGTSIREIIAGSKMKNLQKLSACGCKDLRTIDDSIGNLKSLLVLALDGTAITELPDSICKLTNLQNLSLRNCREVDELPSLIGDLMYLVKLDLSETPVTELPASVERLKNLQVLLMKGTFLREFPEAVTKLESLKEIDFSLCRCMAERIPNGISSLSSLTTLMLSATEISSLPTSISRLSKLQVLDLHKCEQLQDFPSLPTSLTHLHMGSNNMICIPNLSYMTNLTELHLADNTDEYPELTTDGRIPEPELFVSFQWITHLSKLETLELRISKFLNQTPNLGDLQKLRKLVLSCLHLKRLPQLPSSLTTLCLHYCKSLSIYEDLSYLACLSKLELIHCGIESINLKKLSKLQLLQISDCDLKEIIGIKGLLGLRKLKLSNCPQFQRQDLKILEEQGTEVEEC